MPDRPAPATATAAARCGSCRAGTWARPRRSRSRGWCTPRPACGRSARDGDRRNPNTRRRRSGCSAGARAAGRPACSTVRISRSVARKVAVSGRCSKKLLQNTTSTESAGDVRRQLMARREHFFGAGRQHAAGQRLDVHRDAAAAADVAEELAEPGADVEHRRVRARRSAGRSAGRGPARWRPCRRDPPRENGPRTADRGSTAASHLLHASAIIACPRGSP